ncbi:MAG TPA: ABC transporter substrate-binding protein [Balneolaceae bacterium]
MKQYYFLTITVVFFFIGAVLFQPAGAFAQSDSDTIQELLEERDRQIKELLGPKGTEYTEEVRQKLKNMINEIIDYSAMAQFALQETYDTLSTEQRNEFVDLFSTIIRDHSLSNLNIYRADVIYKEIEVNGDTAVVHTLAQLEDVRTPVIYNMKYDDQKGQWVVTDIIIDDVSTAESYRRQFQNIIRRKGYNSLVEILRERAAG